MTAGAGPAGAGSAGALVLRGALVFSGSTASPAVRDVWIVGGHLADPGAAPVGAEESLRRLVVVAGLIDAHVHLCLDAGPDPLGAFRAATPEDLARLARAQAAQTLAAGVTAVRDLGAPTALIVTLRDAIAAGRAGGPLLAVSGAPLTIPGGHLHEMGGAIQDREGAAEAVRERRRAGVDLVKVMTTGGGSSPQTDPRACQFSAAEMAALAGEIRRAGLPFACHAHADAGIKQALDAGAATIEHGSYASEESLRAMAARGVVLVPTLAPALALLETPLSADRRAAVLDRLEARRAAVRTAAAVGVRLAAGTDAGVAHTPHGAVAAEVTALAGCGLSVEAALAAAWQGSAAAMGRSDVGVLTAGARADLLVLDGDPRADLGVLRRPRAVMQAGRWVVPPAA